MPITLTRCAGGNHVGIDVDGTIYPVNYDDLINPVVTPEDAPVVAAVKTACQNANAASWEDILAAVEAMA